MSYSESAGDPFDVIGTSSWSRRARAAGSVVVLAGLIVVVAGTFAPWLTSGGVDRDSYAIAGIVDRLGLAGDGFGATALTWWPFVGPVAMVVLIAGILRWWRTAAWIAVLFGVSTGVIGGGVMAVAGGHAAMGISLADTGPTITVIGASLSVVGGIIVLVGDRRGRASRNTRSAATGPVSREPVGGPSRQSARGVRDGSQ